jgi:phage protein D
MAVSVLGPQIQIFISGIEAPITEFVTSCTVDESNEASTLISMTVANPPVDTPGQQRTSDLLFTDSMVFMPGNIVEVFIGYGAQDKEFIGAGIIQKWSPVFPETGMPTLNIKGFDGLKLMMDGDGERGINATAARRFERWWSMTDIALQIFTEYGFNTDNVVTDVEIATLSIPAQKKAGMSDYAFIRGIANTIGWEFFIRWDWAIRKWKVYFRPPIADDSGKRTFTWGPDYSRNGQVGGLLLEFSPTFAVSGTSTDIEVFYYDEGTQTWEKVIYPEKGPDKEKKPSFKWQGDDTKVSADLQNVGDANSGRGLRIQAGGVSVEVVPETGFKSYEEAFQFAKNWWQARQDMLISGAGSTIGYPKMRPGQVHEFLGIGALNGDWYIAEVTHEFARGSGYRTRFQARKVIP